MASSIRDFVVNVDISNVQFDIDAMYDEAKKLGLDAGDLIEYGFEKRPQCGDKTCFNPEKIKTYDEMLNKTEMLGDKLARSGSLAYKRAMCSPYFRDNIHPKVQFFWAMFPFDCCMGFGPITLLINTCVFPCTFCCIWPVYEWIVIPWNVFCYIGLGPLLLLICCPWIGAFTFFNFLYQTTVLMI